MTISVLDKDGNPQTLDPPTQTTLAADDLSRTSRRDTTFVIEA